MHTYLYACIHSYIHTWIDTYTGASIPPKAMMHFPPCFRFPPLFPKNFLIPWKISQILPFPDFFSIFIRRNFLWPFLVIDHKFWILPYFEEIILSPLLLQISPCFRQIYVFFTYFMCFSFPPTFSMMHLCITQCTYWTPLYIHVYAWYTYNRCMHTSCIYLHTHINKYIHTYIHDNILL